MEVTKKVEVESEEAKRALLQFKLQNNKLNKDLKETKSMQADTSRQLEESKTEVDSLIQRVRQLQQGFIYSGWSIKNRTAYFQQVSSVKNAY